MQEREKFGTYYRDATGLDYADQRYYMSHWGRFLTADPFVSRTALESPTRGWNRYAYVEGDPVNFWDPAGLFIAVPGSPEPPPPSVPWNLQIFPALQDFVGAPGALLMVPAFWSGEQGGGRASTATVSLSVRRLSKEGKEQILIENTLRWISSAIDDDPDCAQWLVGAKSYIDNLLNESLIAHAEFENEPTIAAITGTAGTSVPPGYAAMVINVEGAFFRGGFTVAGGRIQGGTDLARVFILLHELAHGLEVKDFERDFRDAKAGARNDARVMEKCSKTLNRLR